MVFWAARLSFCCCVQCAPLCARAQRRSEAGTELGDGCEVQQMERAVGEGATSCGEARNASACWSAAREQLPYRDAGPAMLPPVLCLRLCWGPQREEEEHGGFTRACSLGSFPFSLALESQGAPLELKPGVDLLTAKASEPDASPSAPRGGKRPGTGGRFSGRWEGGRPSFLGRPSGSIAYIGGLPVASIKQSKNNGKY